MVAIDDEASGWIAGELFQGLRKFTKRKPLMIRKLADFDFIGLPTVDQTRAISFREVKPCRNRLRTDFKSFRRIGQKGLGGIHSTITGVPTSTFSKNFSAMWCGILTQPWEAG